MWQSTEKSDPPIDEVVCLLVSSGDVVFGALVEDDDDRVAWVRYYDAPKFNDGKWQCTDTTRPLLEAPTHWHALPAPPSKFQCPTCGTLLRQLELGATRRVSLYVCQRAMIEVHRDGWGEWVRTPGALHTKTKVWSEDELIAATVIDGLVDG